MPDKKEPLSLVDHILQIAASLRAKPAVSPIDSDKPRAGLGISRSQRQYAIDKYVDDIQKGQVK